MPAAPPPRSSLLRRCAFIGQCVLAFAGLCLGLAVIGVASLVQG